MSVHLERARALLRIPAHRKVASLLEGEYVALHPGRSTEFNDLREYVRGDDPKDLDWKASARARTLLVRRYAALRKLTVLLVVSTGRSMAAAATPEVAKRDVATAVAGVLGHLAVRHGDLVGCAYGDGSTRTVLPARGGGAHVERCLHAVREASTPDAAPSDLAPLLREVGRSVRRRCLVIVVSDTVEAEPEVLSALRRLRVQHEVLMVVVQGMGPLDGRGDSHRRDVDTAQPVPGWLRHDRRLAAQLTAVVEGDRAGLTAALDRLAVAHVHVADLPDVVPAVRRLLERHRRAGR